MPWHSYDYDYSAENTFLKEQIIDNASRFLGLCRHDFAVNIKSRFTCFWGPVEWQAVLYDMSPPYHGEVVIESSWKSEGSSERKVNEALKSLRRHIIDKLHDTPCYHGRLVRLVDPRRLSASGPSLRIGFRR